MNDYPQFPLLEVADVIMGQSPPSTTYNLKGEGLPFYQGKIAFGAINPTARTYCTSPQKIAKEFDILISVRAPIGAMNVAIEECCIGRGLAAIRAKSHVFCKYLYYALSSCVDELVSQGTGSTFKAIGKDILSSITIPLPPIEEQKKIAATLDAVSDLIRLRKRQLEELDLLVKARFVEMFGDPERNPRHFPSLEGKDLFVFSSGKFLEESKRMSRGIPVYGGNGIAWYTDSPLISDATIVIGRVGAYCGNVRHIKEPVWITDNAIFIKKFKTAFINLNFLLSLMTYMNFSKYADFSGQPKITQKPLENQKYIIPPLYLQEEFSSFTEQVHLSETLFQKGLGELEALKNTLMQQYFV